MTGLKICHLTLTTIAHFVFHWFLDYCELEFICEFYNNKFIN